MLRTPNGLSFTDFESATYASVEFDVASVPENVAAFYPALDADLFADCRLLTRAFVATWCHQIWDHSEDIRWVARTFTDYVRSYARPL